MSPDPTLIAAVLAAVENDPGNAALRLHLATLLAGAGREREALEHFEIVLRDQPDHLEALSGAAGVAKALGETRKATSYQNLYEALGWRQTKGLFDGMETPSLPDEPGPPQGAIPVGRFRDGHDDPSLSSSEPLEPSMERPQITLDDVAGMEEIKRRLQVAFLGPLKNPDMMRLYGKSLRGGLLLYGPPGCGKTYIARATAGELGARFLSVGLSDVLDMWLGQSEKNLHELFETARRSRPCVLFFDEIDALGRKRSLMRQSAGRDVVNQLLAELDNVQDSNSGLFVLAATNHPWDVDSALRRPGRLDRTLLVLPPDTSARAAIVRSGLRDRPIGRIDVDEIAARTEGFSGADLAHLCESAAELAIEASLSSGIVRPILQDDFLRALKEIKPSVRTWFDTARNYALFANEGGAYDDLIHYMRANRLA
jgi:AAA+ superfamily predicted ATPase